MAVARTLPDWPHDSTTRCAQHPVETLSQSEWWQQRCDLLRARRLEADRQGTCVSASMGLVHCYADLIQRYWEHLQTTGELKDGHALPVLHWGAGTGRFAYRLLRELRQRLTCSPLSSRDLLYAACEEDARAIELMRAHPRLRDDTAAGRLLIRHVAHDEPEEWLQVIREILPCPGAPLVIIANDVLVESQQELVALQGGKVFDAASPPHGCTEPPQLAWTERPPHAPPPPWQALLRTYVNRLDSVAVLLPTAALNFLDLCSDLTGGHYLLLATDSGIHCERQLRSGACANLTGNPLVNFDALSRHQRSSGAYTYNLAADPQGRVVHLALKRSKSQPGDTLFGSLQQILTRYVPGGAEATLRPIRLSTEEMSCEQLLTAVRLTDDDPGAIALVVEPLLNQLDKLTLECCLRWRHTLERVWNNYFPISPNRNPRPHVGTVAVSHLPPPDEDESENLWLDIGLCAMHVGHWGLAKSAFTAGLATEGDDANVLFRLSYCEAATGHTPNALLLIRRARELERENDTCREFESLLVARLQEWNAHPWYRRGDCCDGELTLEPLSAAHADSLLFQYRDPQIGVMTRLPELETKADVLAWLEQESHHAGCMNCAVMHVCWGFVGMVTLRQQGDSAYFHFWIGTDYQGAGLGQRAARLLLGLAGRSGTTHVFTSAYTSNFRSRAALRQLGFSELDVTALEPDQDLSFFLLRLGDFPAAAGEAYRRLQSLLQSIDSPITLTRLEPDVQAAAGESQHVWKW